MLNGRDPQRALAALRAIDPGADRQTWVRAGMAAKAAGLTFDDWHDWSAGAGNYSGEADCRSVWKSIKEDGQVKAGTLFALARGAGWSDDQPHKTQRPATKRNKSNSQPSRTAFDVRAVWDGSAPADADHPYVIRKGGSPEGLKVYHGLLVPTEN